MRIDAMRAGTRLAVLIALPLLMTGCNDEAPADPIPQLSALTCEVAADGETDRVTFSFGYFDGDADLSDEGGAVRWWVDDVEQSRFPLAGKNLGYSGTLVLSVGGFENFEPFLVRIQAVDAGGNESNSLYAALDTDTDTCQETQAP